MLWRHDRVSIEAMPDLTLRQIEGFNVASFEDNTPRVRDLDIAEWLRYDRPRTIRQLIERNREKLEKFGGIYCRCTVQRQ